MLRCEDGNAQRRRSRPRDCDRRAARTSAPLLHNSSLPLTHRDGCFNDVIPVVCNGREAKASPRGKDEQTLNVELPEFDCRERPTTLRRRRAHCRAARSGTFNIRGGDLTARHVLRQHVTEGADHETGDHPGGKRLGVEQIEILRPIAQGQAVASAIPIPTTAAAPETGSARVRTRITRNGAGTHAHAHAQAGVDASGAYPPPYPPAAQVGTRGDAETRGLRAGARSGCGPAPPLATRASAPGGADAARSAADSKNPRSITNGAEHKVENTYEQAQKFDMYSPEKFGM